MSATAPATARRSARVNAGTPSEPTEALKTDRARQRTPSFIRGVLSGIVTVLLVALIGLALAIAVVPRVLGGASLTVLSGSMEPVYSPGDVVISVPQDQYGIGDVVTFQPASNDPTLITHRIIAVMSSADGPSYVTRGDANGADDEPIVAAQIMGKVRYSVPYIGYVTNAAGGRNVLIVSAVGIVLLAYGAYLFGSGLGEKRRSRSLSPVASPSTDSAAPLEAAPPIDIAPPIDKDAR